MRRFCSDNRGHLRLRRELRRLSPGLRVDTEYLRSLLENEVIKRELVESDDATAAAAIIKKLQRALEREKKKKVDDGESAETSPEDTVQVQPISTPPVTD
jgi:hypothetical protein